MVDVNDLAVAEAFYSELTGIPVIPSVFPGRFAYLGQPDPWRADLIMHLVTTTKAPEANRGHIDIWVSSIDEAIPRIEAIGGSTKKDPTIYPWPGSFPGEVPRIDWAVMRDPFGNEFCLVTILSPEQVRAVLDAAAEGPGDDQRWRAAIAGLTPAPLTPKRSRWPWGCAPPPQARSPASKNRRCAP
ncbi:MAG: VOC family protein [Micromonosporaceae bacterium]